MIRKAAQNLQSVSSSSGWLNSWWGGPIRESFAGAWQQNVTINSQTSLLAFSAVFACVTGIASDIAKMRMKLDKDTDGIWDEVTDRQVPFLAVLRKPNHYQTRIKFLEQWIISKLLYGNTYVLKQRQDKRGLVTALYVLAPQRVTPLVADDGSVWYRLKKDSLSQVPLEEGDDDVFPASEIIHDTMVSFWHPLVGVSPLYACGASATMGNKIQTNSTKFFENLSRPSGILSSPLRIDEAQALVLKTRWEAGYGGSNVGRTAILGDGLKFETITMPAETAQLIEQLRWTVEDVARAFHYPVYKLGGPMPPYSSNLEALNMGYYTDCLHPLIESIEESLDWGLEFPASSGYHVELDLENLIRMDTAALYDAIGKGIGGGFLAPNEGRFKANYGPVDGGNSPMLQQQNYSLAALAKRDAQEDPFKTATPAPAAKPEPAPTPTPPAERGMSLDDLEFFEAELRKELSLA